MSRNLLKYPITLEEVIETLEDAMDRAFDPLAIGGQERAIMADVMKVIEREFRHDDFNP